MFARQARLLLLRLRSDARGQRRFPVPRPGGARRRGIRAGVRSSCSALRRQLLLGLRQADATPRPPPVRLRTPSSVVRRGGAVARLAARSACRRAVVRVRSAASARTAASGRFLCAASSKHAGRLDAGRVSSAAARAWAVRRSGASVDGAVPPARFPPSATAPGGLGQGAFGVASVLRLRLAPRFRYPAGGAFGRRRCCASRARRSADSPCAPRSRGPPRESAKLGPLAPCISVGRAHRIAAWTCAACLSGQRTRGALCSRASVRPPAPPGGRLRQTLARRVRRRRLPPAGAAFDLQTGSVFGVGARQRHVAQLAVDRDARFGGGQDARSASRRASALAAATICRGARGGSRRRAVLFPSAGAGAAIRRRTRSDRPGPWAIASRSCSMWASARASSSARASAAARAKGPLSAIWSARSRCKVSSSASLRLRPAFAAVLRAAVWAWRSRSRASTATRASAVAMREHFFLGRLHRGDPLDRLQARLLGLHHQFFGGARGLLGHRASLPSARRRGGGFLARRCARASAARRISVSAPRGRAARPFPSLTASRRSTLACAAARRVSRRSRLSVDGFLGRLRVLQGGGGGAPHRWRRVPRPANARAPRRGRGFRRRSRLRFGFDAGDGFVDRFHFRSAGVRQQARHAPCVPLSGTGGTAWPRPGTGLPASGSISWKSCSETRLSWSKSSSLWAVCSLSCSGMRVCIMSRESGDVQILWIITTD